MTNHFLAGIPGYYLKADGTWGIKQEKKLILALLIKPLISRKPLTVREIAKALDTDIDVIRTTLLRMAKKGQAVKYGKKWG